jgi:hypothetical protein
MAVVLLKCSVYVSSLLRPDIFFVPLELYQINPLRNRAECDATNLLMALSLGNNSEISAREIRVEHFLIKRKRTILFIYRSRAIILGVQLLLHCGLVLFLVGLATGTMTSLAVPDSNVQLDMIV